MNLAAWRKKRGLDQQQLADYLSAFRGWTVYKPQISSWENGAGMSRSTREMIRSALDAWDVAHPPISPRRKKAS